MNCERCNCELELYPAEWPYPEFWIYLKCEATYVKEEEMNDLEKAFENAKKNLNIQATPLETMKSMYILIEEFYKYLEKTKNRENIMNISDTDFMLLGFEYQIKMFLNKTNTLEERVKMAASILETIDAITKNVNDKILNTQEELKKLQKAETKI